MYYWWTLALCHVLALLAGVWLYRNEGCCCSVLRGLQMCALDRGICRRLEWKNYEVVVSNSKLINVRNVMNDAKEKLDFRDRVIKTSIGFKYMVVVTSSQCYIYRYIFFVISAWLTTRFSKVKSTWPSTDWPSTWQQVKLEFSFHQRTLQLSQIWISWQTTTRSHWPKYLSSDSRLIVAMVTPVVCKRHSISQYNGIWNGVYGRVRVQLEAHQTVIYNKKVDVVTARWHGRLIAEEFNAGHC